MRILVDILHPAHVHFFRPFRTEMERRGHEIVVAARSKEMTTDLLQRYGIEHRVLSRQAGRKLGLAAELVMRTIRLIRLARRVDPDVLTGVMGPSIAPAGRLLGVPSVVFYDTEHAQTNRFVYPLSHAVCTPDCYEGTVPGRHVTYPGYHELAYLHPRRFTPDPSVLSRFGLSADEPYFLIRFVSWQAVHDIGRRGLSREAKLQVVEMLERKGRVVITAEESVPARLEDRVLNGPVEEIHHVTAFSRGVIGESATMCSEAAVLGVPSIYLNPLPLGYLRDQAETYGLVRSAPPSDPAAVLSAVEELPWDVAGGHRRLLEEKVDVTAWMVDFFETDALLR